MQALAKLNDAIIGWLAKLSSDGSVVVDGEALTRKLSTLTPVSTETPSTSEVRRDNVDFDGQLTVPRTLFEIFLGEAQQHVDALRNDLSTTTGGAGVRKTSIRAVHTLAGDGTELRVGVGID